MSKKIMLEKKIQEVADNLFKNEVYVCVSSWAEESFKRELFSYDDIENFYSYPEWSGKVCGEDLYFEGGSDDLRNEFLEKLDEIEADSQSLFDDGKISSATHDRNCESVSAAKDEVNDLETEPQEIYEWWIVSRFLAKDLVNQGAPILDNDYGVFWGRTTTGQSISMDGVIHQIAKNLIERSK